MPSYTKNDIHVDDTINYEELSNSLKCINDKEYLRNKIELFFRNNEKKSNNIDKLIEQKEEEKKKLNNDIQQLKKEKCQLFNIERSIIKDMQVKEYKLHIANVRKNNEELSKKHIMFIDDYSTPKIHLITQDNLIKDEDGYCVEDIVSANELNIKVSFGDIIDKSIHRHYGYTFVDADFNLITPFNI